MFLYEGKDLTDLTATNINFSINLIFIIIIFNRHLFFLQFYTQFLDFDITFCIHSYLRYTQARRFTYAKPLQLCTCMHIQAVYILIETVYMLAFCSGSYIISYKYCMLLQRSSRDEWVQSSTGLGYISH